MANCNHTWIICIHLLNYQKLIDYPNISSWFYWIYILSRIIKRLHLSTIIFDDNRQNQSWDGVSRVKNWASCHGSPLTFIASISFPFSLFLFIIFCFYFQNTVLLFNDDSSFEKNHEVQREKKEHFKQRQINLKPQTLWNFR